MDSPVQHFVVGFSRTLDQTADHLYAMFSKPPLSLERTLFFVDLPDDIITRIKPPSGLETVFVKDTHCWKLSALNTKQFMDLIDYGCAFGGPLLIGLERGEDLSRYLKGEVSMRRWLNYSKKAVIRPVGHAKNSRDLIEEPYGALAAMLIYNDAYNLDLAVKLPAHHDLSKWFQRLRKDRPN